MRPVFVCKADGQRGLQWAEVFRREAPEIDFRFWPEIGDAHAVRYLAAWEPPAGLGAQFPNLATRGLLNATLFAKLPRGASLVHVGRGPQLAGADLLRALDAGQLAEAVLDVTDPEPLPEADPLWSHPCVNITPHIATMTQPHTAARVVIDNPVSSHGSSPPRSRSRSTPLGQSIAMKQARAPSGPATVSTLHEAEQFACRSVQRTHDARHRLLRICRPIRQT